MSGIRVAAQSLAMVTATAVAVSVPALTRLVTFNSPRISARVGGQVSNLWCRALCRILGLRIRVEGAPDRPPFLVAANHLSYLDIFVLGSLYPCQFVAKHEIRSWPAFGWVTRLAGTVFVNRESARDAARAVRTMRRYLSDGISLTVFAEGRIGVGDRVLPFQPTLLEPAIAAKARCYGASISYRTPGAEVPPSETIPWLARANFPKHMARVMRLPRIEVTVSFSAAADSASNRKELARRLWEHVSGTYVPLRTTVEPG